MNNYREKSVEWYIVRLEYYDRILKTASHECDRFRLCGGLEAYTTREGAKAMRNFWFEGLIAFINEEIGKGIKEKQRKKLKNKIKSRNLRYY
jgi:hypothetical protein